MLKYSENLTDYIEDIQFEIEAIRHSFVSCIEEQKDSYKPFAVFFSNPTTKSLAIISRPVVDAGDYYSAIAEMLFSYRATSARAVLLAVDARKEINSQEHDLLEIYMARDDFCEVFSMPYRIDENNKVVWLEELFDVFSLDKLEKTYDTSGYFYATLEIFEALYLSVNLTKFIFDIHKMKSYYTDNGFEYVDLTQKEMTPN